MNIVPSSLLGISKCLKYATKYLLMSKFIIDNIIDQNDNQV